MGTDTNAPFGRVVAQHECRDARHLLRCREGDVFQDALEDGVEAAGANVVHKSVHFLCNLGDLPDGCISEDELHALCGNQCLLLLDHVVLWLRQNPEEIICPAPAHPLSVL